MCTCMKFQLGVLDDLGVHVVLVWVCAWLLRYVACVAKAKSSSLREPTKVSDKIPEKQLAAGYEVGLEAKPAWAIAPDTTPGRL